MALRLRRGTDAERLTITPIEGELIYTTDLQELWIGDGTTVGGNKVSGIVPQFLNDLNNVDAASPEIGQVLKWNGSNWTASADANNGVVENTSYKINITGANSSTIVNSDTNTFAGTFVGDGSGLTNLPEGIVEGSNYRINIVGDDSSIIVNSNNREASFDKTSISSNLTIGDENNFLKKEIFIDTQRAFEKNDTVINNNNLGMLTSIRASRGSILNPSIVNNEDILYTLSNLGWDSVKHQLSSVVSFLVDGNASENVVPGRIALFTADTSGVINTNSGVHITSSQRVGIMTSSPEKTLDVNGDAIIKGDLTAAAFRGSLMADDSTTIIDSISGNITATGVIQFGSFTNTERDQLFPQNGSVIYNTTTNKFQGYANNTWIDLH